MLLLRNFQVNVSPNFQVGPINLDLKPGEITVIIGENGSGKTSLLRALLGEQLSSGTATWNGLDLIQMPSQQRAQTLAIVPQIEDVPFHFTAIETIMMGCLPHASSQWETPPELERTSDAIKLFQLEAIQHQPTNTLSGGERQRCLFARAWNQNPSLLLLDEPTAHVDLKTRAEFATLIPKIAQKVAMLITTHDITWGTSLADQCLLLSKGQAVAKFSPDQAPLDVLHQTLGVRFELAKTAMGRTTVRPID
jgi:iron complex transport system ATP-binding protein